MVEKLTIGLAGAIIIIMLPCLITFFINGRYRTVSVDMLNSGKDVIISSNGENVLMDVEEYIVGVLPGVVEYGASNELIKAQAVAVRTKIYYTMGDKTVIYAQELGYEYYDEEKYRNKYGNDNYKSIKKIFGEAVINTAGELINNN